MSLWSDDRGRRWPLVLGLGCVLMGIVGGVLLMTGTIGGADGADRAPQPAAEGTVPSGGPAEASRPRTSSPTTSSRAERRP